MKTKTLFLIGVLVAFVTISSQLQPQQMSFYKENGNYLVDRNYLIKDVKKLSDADIATMLELQKKYSGALKTNYIFQTVIRNHITIGCLEKADIDWGRYGDLKLKMDVILKKYGAKELNKGYYSIRNNQIVTNAVMLKQKDITSLSKLSVRGADEYSICPDIIGKKNFTNVIVKAIKGNPGIDPRINIKLNDVLASYK